jgi:hypothetical protein
MKQFTIIQIFLGVIFLLFSIPVCVLHGLDGNYDAMVGWGLSAMWCFNHMSICCEL